MKKQNMIVEMFNGGGWAAHEVSSRFSSSFRFGSHNLSARALATTLNLGTPTSSDFLLAACSESQAHIWARSGLFFLSLIPITFPISSSTLFYPSLHNTLPIGAK